MKPWESPLECCSRLIVEPAPVRRVTYDPVEPARKPEPTKDPVLAVQSVQNRVSHSSPHSMAEPCGQLLNGLGILVYAAHAQIRIPVQQCLHERAVASRWLQHPQPISC